MEPGTQEGLTVQFSSVAQLWLTLCDPMDCSIPDFFHHHHPHQSITNSWSLLKLMSINSVMPSNHLILCHSVLLPPSIFPSIRGFSNDSVIHIRWPKYWSISFRIDWFDLLAVQGILKSLQHHSSKASVLRHSAFFTVQLSHPYMTAVKTIALTRQTFVGKVNVSAFEYAI